jgi:hypothetical protein
MGVYIENVDVKGKMLSQSNIKVCNCCVSPWNVNFLGLNDKKYKQFKKKSSWNYGKITYLVYSCKIPSNLP